MFRFLWLGICLLLVSESTSHAQNLSELARSGSSAASFYNYSEPADVTMLVSLWGTVRNPGLYEIPVETSLSHLLSLSGGPIVSQRSPRLNRTIQIQIFRSGPYGLELFYQTEMENEIVASIDELVLLGGDVVTVETIVRQQFGWRDAISIVAAVGTVALAIERIARFR